MPKHLASALIAGLFSGGLFLVVFGTGLGFIFMFLPSFPLFFVSLSPKFSLSHAAIVAATTVITLVAGLASGILFLIFLGLPVWYFSKKALLSGAGIGAGERLWYPIGLIIMHLTLCACVLVALMTWYYAGEPGGLPLILEHNIHEAFADMDSGEYSDIIEHIAGSWSFLLFPLTIWLWGMLLYAHAWLTNRILLQNKRQVRPDMEVQPFLIPSWMLTLLAIAALATLIGSPSMSFLGKMTLLSLMLPYFFLGCTLMHLMCKTWTSGRFFIFFVYFMAVTQFWPVLILALIGLWHQIKCLPAGGSWFRG